jgi:hypothetical protein
MVLDIAKFHRTCPIRPEHKCWFVLQGPKGFYIEHNCPFGCSSSSSNAGGIASAITDVWEAEGVKPVNRYEDDLLAFRFPISSIYDLVSLSTRFTYAYDRMEALALIGDVNTPWHPLAKKGQNFDFEAPYIGYHFDIAGKRAKIPEPKREKFLRRVRTFVALFRHHQCQIDDVDKLHGSLCHLTFIHSLGRSHLPALSTFSASFKGDTYMKRYAPASVWTALQWWDDTLSKPNIWRSLVARGPLQDLHIYVDASTDWGIGVVLDGRWDAWKGIGSWNSDWRHIGWLEAIALEFVIYAIEKADLRDAFLLVHSDNKGVIGAFDKGRSRNFEINLSIRRSHYVLASRNITLDLTYIRSADNPADPLSRGALGTVASRIPVTSFFTLPDELLPYFSHV